MSKNITEIQVTSSDMVLFYSGNDVVMAVSRIVPPSSTFLLIDGTDIMLITPSIGNGKLLSDGRTNTNDPFIFSTQFLTLIGAKDFPIIDQNLPNAGDLGSAKALSIYSWLLQYIFQGCCDCGCDGKGCSFTYQWGSTLTTGQFYFSSGLLIMDANSYSAQDLAALLAALPDGSWVTFISQDDATLFSVFEINNYVNMSGFVSWDATLVDGSSTFTANPTFCVTFQPALGGGGGTVTSVGLTMPSAFNVANSPVTTTGTLSVTGAGLTSQYIRGDGTLANFPTSIGGGASVSYYLNGSINQGVFSGNTYYEMNKVPVIGLGTNFSIATNGYISRFITDANDPSQLNIPAGNWTFEMYFNASSSGGSPRFYVELYKWDGVTFTLIASSSANPEGITNGTTVDLYVTALAVPATTLTLTDRLAVRVYVINSGRTITLHTEDNNLCQIITTFTTGVTALNGLTEQVQTLTTGTTGTDFNISSAVATHTFNLPVASALNTGKLSAADWTTFNNKGAVTSIFGGGEDGDYTASSGTLTLTRDSFYNNINLSGTAVIRTSGWRLFCKTLTISGTANINNNASNGNNATTGTGAVGGSGGLGGGFTAVGQTGTSGGSGAFNGNGASGAAPATLALSFHFNIAGASGKGGDVTAPSRTGGASQVGPTPTNIKYISIIPYVDTLLRITTQVNGSTSGDGGGAGGSASAINQGRGGGGGGGGAGSCIVFAEVVDITAAPTAPIISAIGGTGGNGLGSTFSDVASSGGGSGGSGGYVMLIYKSISGSLVNALDASGGAGGNGGSGTFVNTTGGDGGGNGGGGRIVLINVSTGAVTHVLGSNGVVGSAAVGITGGNGAIQNSVTLSI